MFHDACRRREPVNTVVPGLFQALNALKLHNQIGKTGREINDYDISGMSVERLSDILEYLTHDFLSEGIEKIQNRRLGWDFVKSRIIVH